MSDTDDVEHLSRKANWPRMTPYRIARFIAFVRDRKGL